MTGTTTGQAAARPGEAPGGPDPAAGPGEPPEALQPGQGDGPPDQDRPAGANREAASYRTRLRAAEAERDALKTQLTTLRRAEVERVAGEHLAAPEDAWGPWQDDVDRFVDEEGRVDTEAVQTAAQELAKQRPTWRKGGPPRRDPDQGKGNRPSAFGNGGGSWAAVVRPGN